MADQAYINSEHIIVDNLSVDGSGDWLKNNDNIIGIIEKDSGMYEAINKGLKIARGEIIGFLNCDEQYLPNILKLVKDYFIANPDVDVIHGNAIMVAPQGSFIAFQKGYKARMSYIMVGNLYFRTSTMFFRKKIIDAGIFFDPDFRIMGDKEFVMKLLKAGYSFDYIRHYLSIFTITGENLSKYGAPLYECENLSKTYPFYVKRAGFILNLLRLTEKFITGCYFQRVPFSYDIYVESSQQKRNRFIVNKPIFRWSMNL